MWADKISTKLLARGRWGRILRELGVPGKHLRGLHGPCMWCGGRDRARFTDHKNDGWYHCNQCGALDGFAVLMRFHNWTFAQAAGEVDRLIGRSSTVSASRRLYREMAQQDECPVPKSVRDCALWLRRFHPEKLGPWLEGKHPEVRYWLEEQS